MNDPANRQVQTSFGSFQSMFVVPGPQPWLPAPGVPRGAIARHTFHSAVANDDRDFFVYTPAGYDARRAQPYPVLYPAARSRRRCGALGERGRRERHPRQPDRAGEGRADGHGHDARLRREQRPGRRDGAGEHHRLHEDPARGSDADGGARATTSAGTASSARSPACRWAAPKRSTPVSTTSTSSRGLVVQRRVRVAGFAMWPGADTRAAAPGAAAGGVARGAAPAGHRRGGLREELSPRSTRRPMRRSGCCGSSAARPTASIGVNRQFKTWLKSKNDPVHRTGSAGHRPRLAAVAAELRRHGAAAVSALTAPLVEEPERVQRAVVRADVDLAQRAPEASRRRERRHRLPAGPQRLARTCRRRRAAPPACRVRPALTDVRVASANTTPFTTIGVSGAVRFCAVQPRSSASDPPASTP